MKVICEADYDEFLEEQDRIITQLFEDYKKRNTEHVIDEVLKEELKLALCEPVQESDYNLI